MARQVHTPVAVTGGYPSTGQAFAFLAADTVNFDEFVMTGKEILIAQNTGASPHTISIDSVADAYGRLGDIAADSIAAGAFEMYGPFPTSGWKQSDGTLNFEADNAEVEFAVIRLQ